MKKVYFISLLFFCLSLNSQILKEPSFRHLPAGNFGVKTAYGQTWDQQGKMWLVYEEGILSYNGYSAKRFKHVEGDSSTLLSTIVQGLFIDKKNNLWIIYGNMPGITKMNLKNETMVHFLPDTNSTESVPSALIAGFREDSKGNLWLLTWGGGIAKMNTETGKCKTYKPNPNDPNDIHCPKTTRCKALVELPDGRFLMALWGSEGRKSVPCYFDPEKETFIELPVMDYLNGVDQEEKNYILTSLNINHFAHVDEEGKYWFGTYSGLLVMDHKNKTLRRITANKSINGSHLNLDNASRCVIDEDGLMWVGSPNNCIMLVNTKTCEAKYIKYDSKNANSIADNRIRTMKKDPDGNIWVGTEAGIFSIYIPVIQKFSIAPWDEMGLGYSNRSSQTVPVNQLVVRKDGKIYIASETGITVYDAYSKKVIDVIDPVKIGMHTNLTSDSKSRVNHFKFIDSNHVFIVGGEDVVTLDLTKKSIKRFDIEIPSDDEALKERYKKSKDKYFLRDLMFRNNNDVTELILAEGWRGRLFKLGEGKKANTFSVFADLGKNSDIYSSYNFQLPDGRWIISSHERKFYTYDNKTKKTEMYSYKDGTQYFPDSTITSIYRDNNKNYWVCTRNGLYSYDFINSKWEYINPKLGLGIEEVNAIAEDKNGIWWVALEKQILRWDSKTNKVFTFGNEFGLNANSFIGIPGQIDDRGTVYLSSVNGIISFDPAQLSIPDTKPIVRLSLLSVKDDTLNKSALDEFLNGKLNLDWNKNFLNFEFCSNQVFTPLPHRFFYRLIGLDTSWQNNEISNKIRFTNLSPGSYTLEVKIKNSFDIESDALTISFKINPPFWKTWWFYTLAAGTLLLITYGYMRYRERAFRKKQELLESKIKERTAEVVAKAKEIEQQKDIIVEKNKELTDSIHYAQRIQQSILPQDKEIRNGLKEHFVYFKPKDIVSGDFYWYSEQKDSILWAVVDCTGHGVPGGFMSMLGSGLLNQIVNEELKLEPNLVLDQLRDRVIIALKQTGEYGDSRDGMDLAFCRYIPKENKLQFAGANNSIYKVSNGEISEIKPDKQPIGIYVGEQRPFKLNEIDVQKGDCFYISSDGYADQFGGPKGKKFKSSNLEKLFLSISQHNIEEQKQLIDKTFQEWKGVYEQLDDVCVIGVKL
ncbi:MAG: SpoIIE family protein phosphatase [Bacteroidia bacterium]|nr:SpoIIE family protein phosphatase [Bacteroidia bacterium]